MKEVVVAMCCIFIFFMLYAAIFGGFGNGRG